MSEWSVLEAKVKTLEQQISQLSRLVGSGGELNADIFSHMAGRLTILPHEAAALYSDSSQAFSTGATIRLVGDATNDATWSKGYAIAPTSGEVQISGIPRQTLLGFNAWIEVSSAVSTGATVGLLWNCDDGSVVNNYQVLSARPAFGPWHLELTHIRQVRAADQSYFMTAYSNEAGVVEAFSFSCVRLR